MLHRKEEREGREEEANRNSEGANVCGDYYTKPQTQHVQITMLCHHVLHGPRDRRNLHAPRVDSC